MKAIANILSLFAVLLAGTAFGQVYTSKANNCYKAKDYVCAKIQIDSAITSSERFNSQTWQLRGLIYRKMETSETSNYRDISIESLVRARNLDSAGVYTEQIDKFLYSTIIRYYNDAVIQLEGKELESSESSYALYKSKYKKYVDEKFDFSSIDIEYYNALGSEYLKLVPTLQGDEKDKKVAKGVHFFELILDQDTNLFQPNFNVGIMYYNQGVDLIMNMDPLTPIEDIPKIEARAQIGFKKALPYLHSAHRIEPERSDVVEAIAGCYYGLQDNDNYLKYQKFLDTKNLPILLEKIEKDPSDKDVLEELTRIYYTTFKDEEKYHKYYEMLEKLGE